jgi:hypothetical protein
MEVNTKKVHTAKMGRQRERELELAHLEHKWQKEIERQREMERQKELERQELHCLQCEHLEHEWLKCECLEEIK